MDSLSRLSCYECLIQQLLHNIAEQVGSHGVELRLVVHLGQKKESLFSDFTFSAT